MMLLSASGPTGSGRGSKLIAWLDTECLSVGNHLAGCRGDGLASQGLNSTHLQLGIKSVIYLFKACSVGGGATCWFPAA